MSGATISTTPLLEARGITMSFGGVRAARDINIAVNSGQHLAIIGQNGAGKSTFLNLCTGYLKPASGRIAFCGCDVTGLSPRVITRMGIARAFQHPQLFMRQTVIDNLRFAVATRARFWQPWRVLTAQPYDAEARSLLNLFELSHVAEHIAGDTAEGVRKLLDIAMALAVKPRLLLLDEPTSGVSTEEKFGIMDTLVHALETRSVTAVFVEHDMAVVQRYAQRVGVWVDGGILAAGTPETVLADPQVLEQVL